MCDNLLIATWQIYKSQLRRMTTSKALRLKSNRKYANRNLSMGAGTTVRSRFGENGKAEFKLISKNGNWKSAPVNWWRHPVVWVNFCSWQSLPSTDSWLLTVGSQWLTIWVYHGWYGLIIAVRAQGPSTPDSWLDGWYICWYCSPWPCPFLTRVPSHQLVGNCDSG